MKTINANYDEEMVQELNTVDSLYGLNMSKKRHKRKKNYDSIEQELLDASLLYGFTVK